jgi:hypothetical protein
LPYIFIVFIAFSTSFAGRHAFSRPILNQAVHSSVACSAIKANKSDSKMPAARFRPGNLRFANAPSLSRRSIGRKGDRDGVTKEF